MERLVARYEASIEEGESGESGGTVVQELTGRSLDIQTIRRTRRTVGVLAVEGAGIERVFDIGVKTGPDAWSDPVRVDAGGALIEGPLGPSLKIRRMSREEALASILQTTPQRRLIDPGEVASVATMLCGEGARGINGQAIGIDGGEFLG